MLIGVVCRMASPYPELLQHLLAACTNSRQWTTEFELANCHGRTTHTLQIKCLTLIGACMQTVHTHTSIQPGRVKAVKRALAILSSSIPQHHGIRLLRYIGNLATQCTGWSLRVDTYATSHYILYTLVQYFAKRKQVATLRTTFSHHPRSA